MTVRVRNVTVTGFEYRLQEWEYEDGMHVAETFSYLALEPGTFQIGSVTWNAVRLDGITASPQATPLTGFATAPVVLAQIQTDANPQAVIARVSAVAATGFTLQLQEESANASPVTGESVGILAATTGTATLDGAAFHVGRTAGAGVASAWTALGFGASYLNPLLFAQTQTLNGVRPVTLRQQALTPSGVQIELQAELSNNPSTVHNNEQIGYLVLAEAEGELRAKLQFGSFQVPQPDRTTWHAVTFDRPYINPVVVFGPLAQGDADPGMVRVRNVTGAGFEFQLAEWDYQDGVHAADNVSYLVAEAGSYMISGVHWIFGRASGVTNTPAVHSFSLPFGATPVVLTQVVTTAGPAAVQPRVSAVTTTGFTLELDEEQAADGLHSGETVHYVAVKPGSARMVSSRYLFEAGVTPRTVTDAFAPLTFQRTLAKPFFLGQSQTRLGTSPIVTRYRNLSVKGVEVRVQEETSRDPNTTHPGEAIGYLTLSSVVDMDEDGMADDWELAHGLNPNDPADAALDPDGDGRSNLQEYEDGTDPHVADSGPVVTVTTTASNAYKKEGTPAKFRIDRLTGGGLQTITYTMSGQASAPGQTGAEYRLTDGTGNPLTGSITMAAGDTSAEIDVVPIADGSNRYPESVVVTLVPGPGYQIGAAPSASATLADAAPTPENDQLFVAFMTRQGSADTYASGVGTLYLNGPKNAARVSLSFSGLTSAQTNAYLRYGNPGGVGTELRPTLGTGQVSNIVWNIVPAGPYSGQSIIDALFQKGGQYTYVNLGTGNYPVGEIAGTWTRQTGSSTFTPPAAAPAIAPLAGSELLRDVARFLTQATFGPTQADIDSLSASVTGSYGGDRIAAFSAWIDQQLSLPQTNLLDLVQAADARSGPSAAPTPLTSPAEMSRGTTIAGAAGGFSLRSRTISSASAWRLP